MLWATASGLKFTEMLREEFAPCLREIGCVTEMPQFFYSCGS